MEIFLAHNPTYNNCEVIGSSPPLANELRVADALLTVLPSICSHWYKNETVKPNQDCSHSTLVSQGGLGNADATFIFQNSLKKGRGFRYGKRLLK